MIKEYDYYLFDFDGTLFDTIESLYPVFKYGFKAVGKSCSNEECEKFIHMSLKQTALSKGIKDEYEAFEKAIVESLDFEESIKLIKPFDDTFKILDFLKKKKLGIVTGNCEGHIMKVFDFFKIENPFSCIVGNESYAKTKPDKEPVEVALRKLNISDKSKVVYVGDSLQDVACANAAGIDGILIDRENNHPDFNGFKIEKLSELIIIS